MNESGTAAPAEVNEHVIPARPCTVKDFNKNEEYKEIFEINERLSLNLFCPAFELFDGNVSITGSRNNMR